MAPSRGEENLPTRVIKIFSTRNMEVMHLYACIPWSAGSPSAAYAAARCLQPSATSSGDEKEQQSETGTHEHQQGLNELYREGNRESEQRPNTSGRLSCPMMNILQDKLHLSCLLPVCVLGMYGHGLAAEVLAPVEMPDHRDLPQNHPALGHWEAAGGSEQVRAPSGPREVTLLHPDGPLREHRHHGLPVSGL